MKRVNHENDHASLRNHFPSLLIKTHIWNRANKTANAMHYDNIDDDNDITTSKFGSSSARMKGNKQNLIQTFKRIPFAF